MASLAQAAGDGALPRPETLSLVDNPMGDGGMRALAAAIADGALTRLENLDLSNSEIGDAGVEAFVAACVNTTTLPRLTRLDLEDNKIGNVGMRALAKAIGDGGLASLTTVIAYPNPDSLRPLKGALRQRMFPPSFW